jgi:hypothetical protein
MLTDKERDRISGLLVIKEPEDTEPYAIENSRILLNVEYTIDQNTGKIQNKITGDIVSEVFIGNTDLEFAKTWKFEIYGVRITGFSVDTKENMVYHHFIAGDYLINDGEDDDTDGKEG